MKILMAMAEMERPEKVKVIYFVGCPHDTRVMSLPKHIVFFLGGNRAGTHDPI
jgi:hypothetical protein